jgi:hypothetical protein
LAGTDFLDAFLGVCSDLFINVGRSESILINKVEYYLGEVDVNSFNFKISDFLRWKYSEDELCVYFLSKNIHTIYQLDDDYITNWYGDVFDTSLTDKVNARKKLIVFYTNMLMNENKFESHLDYWVEKCGRKILNDIDVFFSGDK